MLPGLWTGMMGSSGPLSVTDVDGGRWALQGETATYTAVLRAIVSGGVQPYTYQWAIDEVAAVLTGANSLIAGASWEGDARTNISLTVTDALGTIAVGVGVVDVSG